MNEGLRHTDLYETVQEHIAAGHVERLKDHLGEASLVELLNLVQALRPAERAIVYRLFPKEQALQVFESLDVEWQQELISGLADTEAREVFAALEPDDRADLLDELPAGVASKLLAALSPEARERTALVMGYPPETAGHIMTPKYVRLSQTSTVQEALQRLRTVDKDTEDIFILYVTDESRRLVGELSFKDLALADAEQRISELMDEPEAWVTTHTDQEDAARLMEQLDLLAIPVVDQERRLVGVITIDDAIDILDEETTEDIFERAALTPLAQRETNLSYRLAQGPVWESWAVRLPFLAITLLGGMLAGGVINVFEEALETITVLAFFIPVVMDMGGNAGAQSSTIFSRALVLGHINVRQFGRHLLREMSVGLSMGAILGLIAGIIASIWQPVPRLGWVVGMALAATMTLATTLGFLIPYLLFKLGLDQAAGADPIITTIKDITGLLIYFSLAYLLMGPVLG